MFSGCMGILVAAVAMIIDGFQLEVAAIMVGLGGPMILEDRFRAITFMDDGFRVTGFRPPRTLRYSEIAAATIGETQAGVIVKTINFAPTRGFGVGITPFTYVGFYGPDGWGSLLLAALKSHHIQSQPELLEHLERAAAHSETDVRVEQAAAEARKEDPPISF